MMSLETVAETGMMTFGHLGLSVNRTTVPLVTPGSRGGTVDTATSCLRGSGLVTLTANRPSEETAFVTEKTQSDWQTMRTTFVRQSSEPTRPKETALGTTSTLVTAVPTILTWK